MSFRILYRTEENPLWQVYGKFETEEEFHEELPYIRSQNYHIKRAWEPMKDKPDLSWKPLWADALGVRGER